MKEFYFAIIHNNLHLGEDKENTLENYNKLISNLKLDDYFKYEKLIENGENIPDENIEDFLNDVELYRIIEGRIPQKSYNYIIKETIRGKIDKEKYEYVVRHCILDLTKDTLTKYDLNQDFSVAFCSEELDKTVIAAYTKR